jgi:CheY-like chemotaxis protein
VHVRRRVLVVDDNIDAAETLADGLRLVGHEVEVVHDGHSALETAGLALPEVAVLDIGLPGMTGHDLARALREMAAGRPLRLIALSGYGQESDRKRSLEAGIDVHFTKPVELDVIQTAVAGQVA